MKKILIFIFLGVALSACVNLNRNPVDAYSSSTFFTNETAAMSNLASVYSAIDLSGFWLDGDAIEFDNITDNSYCPFTNQLPYYIALGSSTPSLTGKYNDLYREYFSTWGYSGIRSANYFIENIDNVSSMDTIERKQMKAEAIFLRAADYARMMMCFGGVPLVTKVLQYGEENAIPRSTEAEIATFVESQLAIAANDLPLTRSSDQSGRATKGAALALKARVELFEGDYKDAAADSKAVMNLGIYGLCSNYESLFWEKSQDTPDRNQEVIFEVRYSYPDWGSGVSPFYTVPEGGWNSDNPTQSLVDAYETKNGLSIQNDPTYDPDHPYQNRDPRFYATIIYPGESWNGRVYNPLQPVGPDEYYNSSHGNRSRTGYGLRKWCAPADTLMHAPDDSQGINFIVIRYAEVLLTYAEALIELNQNLPDAAAAINQVRARVGMPPVTATDQAGLRACVRNERRVELAFEGLRWYDIKRWKIGSQVMNGPVYGVRPGTINMTTQQITWLSPNHITVGPVRVWNDRNYYFPIPQEDIDASPILFQNPGW
jgi:hypothetical protein